MNIECKNAFIKQLYKIVFLICLAKCLLYETVHLSDTFASIELPCSSASGKDNSIFTFHNKKIRVAEAILVILYVPFKIIQLTGVRIYAVQYYYNVYVDILYTSKNKTKIFQCIFIQSMMVYKKKLFYNL